MSRRNRRNGNLQHCGGDIMNAEIKEIAPINNTQVLELVKGDFVGVSIDQKITWKKDS